MHPLCGWTSGLWKHLSKVLGSFTNFTSLLLQGGPWEWKCTCRVNSLYYYPILLREKHREQLFPYTCAACAAYKLSTSTSAYVKYFYPSKACQKNPHWTHSTLQTSPAQVNWEPGTLPRGNHAVVAVSFPSDCCLCSLLPDQVSGELFSLLLHVHSRSPGLAPPPCTLEKKSRKPTAYGESGTRGCFGLGSHICQNNKKINRWT